MQKLSITWLITSIILLAQSVYMLVTFLNILRWTFGFAPPRWAFFPSFWFAYSAFIILTIFTLLAGIMGVFNWKKPENAHPCFLLGLITISVGLLSALIFHLSHLFFFWRDFLYFFLPVYVVYTVATYLYRKFSQSTEAEEPHGSE